MRTSAPGPDRRIDLPTGVELRRDPLNLPTPQVKETTMRLSLLASLGIAAFLGLMAMATPDAQARRTTIVSSPRGTTVVTRRPGRVAAVRLRGARGQAIRLRGARGAVITTSRPGLTCRTVIANGVRVRRCR
jgi:hypothetical protein